MVFEPPNYISAAFRSLILDSPREIIKYAKLSLRLRFAVEDRPSILRWLNAEFAGPTADAQQRAGSFD